MATRPLTVLQVLPALESGGVERGVLEVAEALVAAGHRSLVISGGGRMVDELTNRGSTHFGRAIGTKSPLTLQHVYWLRQLMIEQQVDVVDIHSRLPGWITWLAWKSLSAAKRPALISTVHGLHSVGFYSSIMCRGEHVIVVSETVLEHVRRNYRFVPEARLHLIHRGIDGDEFPRGYQPDDSWNSEFSRQFPRTCDQPLLTLVGRLTRLKGHADLLHLLARLKDRGIAAHGLIVGGTDPRKAAYADEMQALAASLNLSDRVTFTGHRSDLKQIYAMSSIVLSLSSTPESFGRTVAEALSIGTPVVGYNHGGGAEILAAQFPAGAVEIGNLETLTETVALILARKPRPVPGPNVFEKERMLRKTLDVYEMVGQKAR
ncbi:MAG: glycosyltransferase [Planctomycetota bacterium]|nr:MAG: glycosyltransferase [Planctomycetota bacterium]